MPFLFLSMPIFLWRIQNGGFSNAYTSQENTVYYFDVLPTHLEEALSMFSSFFKCPLFEASSSDREMNAVDSENSKNLQNDDWRDFQVREFISYVLSYILYLSFF